LNNLTRRAGRGEVLRFDPVSGRLHYSSYELVRVPQKL
jgi:hypothetical protein